MLANIVAKKLKVSTFYLRKKQFCIMLVIFEADFNQIFKVITLKTKAIHI